jgi:hypothetical protein
MRIHREGGGMPVGRMVLIISPSKPTGGIADGMLISL